MEARETSMVLLRCLLVSEIMHGGAPEVFLHKWKLECYHITFYQSSGKIAGGHVCFLCKRKKMIF